MIDHSSRRCEQCGGPLDGMSSRARFCSTTCRTRSAKGHPATPAAEDEPPHAQSGRQAAAVLAELASAGRQDSALGVAALALAERVDKGAQETGAALAALVKALRETLAEALKDAEASGDLVDELREARERRQARARG